MISYPCCKYSVPIHVMWLFLILTFQSYAQKSEDIEKLFPGVSAVYLKKEVNAFYGKRGDNISLYTTNNSVTYFLDNNANHYIDNNVYYSGLIMAENIEAKTIINENGKDKIFRSSKIIDKDVVEPGIFYDDGKVKEILYPNIQKGAKALLSYKSTYVEPRLFGPVLLSSHIPILDFVFNVTFHKDIKLQYHYIALDETKLTFTTTQEKDYITYSWHVKNIPSSLHFANAPNRRYYEPQIVVYVASLTNNDKVINYAVDRQGLYAWCSNFLVDINKNSEQLLKLPLDSIISGSSSDLEKSQKIFYWVQDNIKYIAFEDGYGGYIPRNAKDIYSKRYGDCKDMANLITVFHKMAGLEAYHTWIGTRDIPYQIDKMPMPCDFNHMISCSRIDGQWYFLDATGRNMRYGLPTSMIQGKEALLSFSRDSSLILKVPEIKADENLIKEEIELSLFDKSLKGTVNKTLRGFPMSSTLLSLNYKNMEERDSYLKKSLVLGNNKCSVSEVRMSAEENYKSPEIHILYKFNLPDYVLNLSSDVFVNLNLEKELSEDKIDIMKRKVSYELDYKKDIVQRVAFTIPEGYEIGYLPNSYEYDGGDFRFQITYQKTGNQIIMNKSIKLDFLLLDSNKFEKWNKMIELLNKAYKETISLKRG